VAQHDGRRDEAGQREQCDEAPEGRGRGAGRATHRPAVEAGGGGDQSRAHEPGGGERGIAGDPGGRVADEPDDDTGGQQVQRRLRRAGQGERQAAHAGEQEEAGEREGRAEHGVAQREVGVADDR
jgi:hypothetical protein